MGNYISLYSDSASGGAIYNDGTIGDITGDFIGNYAYVTDKYSSASGGAICNVSLNNSDVSSSGIIGIIEGNFIGNYAQSNSYSAYGGAIYNTERIADIRSDFIGNYAQGSSSAYGGAIYNDGTVYHDGKIEDITGDFIGNYAQSSSSAYGGAIYNSGTTGDITGDFIGNYAQCSFSALGGAIYNGRTIGNITGDFIGNYAQGSGSSGGAISNGAISIDHGSDSYIGAIKGNFIGNSADNGGAIYNGGSYFASIDSIVGDFIGNSANKGGAIYNSSSSKYGTKEIGSISGDFIDNYASGSQPLGGAIYNKGKIENITGDFIGNYVFDDFNNGGGAIYNSDSGIITSIKSNFIGNNSSYIGYYNGYSSNGGAIYNSGTIGDITGDFIGNYAQSNSSTAGGGAIYNSGTMGDITGDFIGNYAQGEGGAIYNTGTIGNTANEGVGGIVNSSFINNYAEVNGEDAQALGGAIYTLSNLSIIAKDGILSLFSGNKTITNGEEIPNAVYVDKPYPYETKEVVSINRNNVCYKVSLSSPLPTLTIDATTNGSVLFNDSIDGKPYEEKTFSSSLSIESYYQKYYKTIDEFIDYAKENYWWCNDEMTEEEILKAGFTRGYIVASDDYEILYSMKDGYDLKLTGDSTGSIIINNYINNADISVENTNVYVSEGRYLSNNPSLTVASGVVNIDHMENITNSYNYFSNSGTINFNNIDVDLENKSMGRMTSKEYGPSNGVINVKDLNLLNYTERLKTDVLFADKEIASSVSYLGSSQKSYTAVTPIYIYDVSYGVNSTDEQGYFSFVRSGYSPTDPTDPESPLNPPSNPSDSFNPSVLTSAVTSQAGAYTNQLQAFNYVFEHSTVFMNLPQLERLAIKERNKYALSPTGDVSDVGQFSPLMLQQDLHGFWVKPYVSFENVPLKNGPKVSNINYGTLIGYDSEMKTTKNGFDRVVTGYVGYNGASQRYRGVDAYQNGAILGTTATFYKNNFFNATTLSVGASSGDATSMYGSESYAMLLAGIANKTGYNFEFKDGAIILQPNFMISYTFVNTFDYTNAAGVRIKSDPLNAIQLAPGIKLIGNTRNGWQPYVSVNMVWNLLQDAKITANDVRLPEMSIRPYVQYGVGVQKNFKDDRITAYGQAMINNGGRNGLALTLGFRWNVGK